MKSCCVDLPDYLLVTCTVNVFDIVGVLGEAASLTQDAPSLAQPILAL